MTVTARRGGGASDLQEVGAEGAAAGVVGGGLQHFVAARRGPVGHHDRDVQGVGLVWAEAIGRRRRLDIEVGRADGLGREREGDLAAVAWAGWG